MLYSNLIISFYYYFWPFYWLGDLEQKAHKRFSDSLRRWLKKFFFIKKLIYKENVATLLSCVTWYRIFFFLLGLLSVIWLTFAHCYLSTPHCVLLTNTFLVPLWIDEKKVIDKIILSNGKIIREHKVILAMNLNLPALEC